MRTVCGSLGKDKIHGDIEAVTRRSAQPLGERPWRGPRARLVWRSAAAWRSAAHQRAAAPRFGTGWAAVSHKGQRPAVQRGQGMRAGCSRVGIKRHIAQEFAGGACTPSRAFL